MPAKLFTSRGLAIAFAVGLIGMTITSEALVCSCARLPADQSVRSTPVIFEGRILDVQRFRRPGMGFDEVTATIRVSTSWKGEVAGQVQVHGHSAYSLCGYDHFPVGQTLLVLAFPRAEGGGLTTNSCTMAASFGEARAALGITLGSIASNRGLLEREVVNAREAVLPVIRLARHFEQWQDWPAAAQAYASAARAAPALQAAHAGEGRALFSLQRYRDAIPALARAAALPPFDSEANRLLGQARFLAGDRTAVAEMSFRGFEARDLDLRGLDLGGRDFSEARLTGARLDDARLAGARLVRAMIHGGSLVGADLRGADLSQAQLGNDLSRARLDGAELAGASLFGVLRGASLRGVSGQDANLGNTEAAGAVLADARLPLALLHNADLTDADLTGASLVGAFLNGARLCGANLSGADLTGADLRRARFDARTRFPEGFDPITAGMAPAMGANCRPPP